MPTEIAKQGSMKVPVRMYTSLRPGPPDSTIAALKQIASLPVLAEAVVALPDLHHKPQLECPSSLATATNEHIVLGLSSPSPNCGMALAKLDLYAGDVDGSSLDALFGELASRLHPTRRTAILSADDVIQILLSGAKAAVERYGLDPDTLDHMDQGGDAFVAPPDVSAVLDAIPHALRNIGRLEFGILGRGNHFLELQVIDRVYDTKIACAWELAPQQIVALFHADSGHLGALAGRLYAHRRKNTWQGRVREWQVKLPFHMATKPRNRVLHRINYHLMPRRLTPIPLACEEAQRALLALQAASNYAYANRLAVLAALRDAFHTVWGENCMPPALLWDASHNGIRQEIIGERPLWIHRHNSARALPPSLVPVNSLFAKTGQPVLMPGMDCTSSYLCVAGEGVRHTFHSVNHGAGYTALQMGQHLPGNATTRRYTYGNSQAEIVAHLSDDGLQEVLSLLQSHEIARPVARLRPVAVLKAAGSAS